MEDPSPAERALPQVARFRFLLQALEPVRLPPYAGSVWRGLLGLGLRRAACVTRQPSCEGCLLRHACVYSLVFESPATEPAEARRYKELPHPFALEIPPAAAREIDRGEPILLGITLIGPAIGQMPYLIQAMQIAGQHGAGQSRGRFTVLALEREANLGQADWLRVYEAEQGAYTPLAVSGFPPAPPVPDVVQICLETPLRLKRQGHLVGAAELDAHDLLRNLCARLALLARHYGGVPDAFDWGRLGPPAESVEIEKGPGLHWLDWTRYSGRQHGTMKMGGLVGELRLRGPGLAAFWPALRHGQWVHLGKGTSFGLGAYRIESPGSAPPV